MNVATVLALTLLTAAAARGVDIVAHRGASYDAPENTMAATRLAWQQGADAVETDIVLSRDGKLVVTHDKNAKRTAGRDVEYVAITQAEARKFDAGSWKDSRFKGEKIPLLEDQISSIPPGKRMLVEIKVGPEIVPELKRVLAETGGTEKNITIISFNYDALVEVRKQLPALPTLWLVGHPAADAKKGGKKTPKGKRPPTLAEMIRKAESAGFTGLDLQHTWPLSAADVQKIRKAGLELHVWTVNDVAIAKHWAQLGVASITTDRPGWLRQQLGE